MAFPEYEIAGIETIARGICIKENKLLICRAKGGKTAYLPGGHIEFGETGRAALCREIKEELGLDAKVGAFRGVVENQFLQHGKPHAEINLVYELILDENALIAVSQEDWIEFAWCPLKELKSVHLLPAVFEGLAQNPNACFEV